MNYFGVETIETDEGIWLKKIYRRGTKTQSEESSNYQIIKSINLQNTPDLTPALTVIASATNAEVKLSGLKNLKIKESDRLQALETELKKCGFSVNAKDDSLFIHPVSNFQLPTSNIRFETHNDHRIAMAFAPLAILFDEVIIENPDVVEKSYPTFWSDLKLSEFELEFNN